MAWSRDLHKVDEVGEKTGLENRLPMWNACLFGCGSCQPFSQHSTGQESSNPFEASGWRFQISPNELLKNSKLSPKQGRCFKWGKSCQDKNTSWNFTNVRWWVGGGALRFVDWLIFWGRTALLLHFWILPFPGVQIADLKTQKAWRLAGQKML